MKRLVLAILLLAIPATADVNEWVNCGSTEQITRIRVGPSECIEYSWNNVTLPGLEFAVTSGTALACFAPDVVSGATVATATVKRCVPGRARGANSCETVTAAALNGTGGAAGTQTRCVRLGKGEYLLDTVSTGDAADTAVFSVESE